MSTLTAEEQAILKEHDGSVDSLLADPPSEIKAAEPAAPAPAPAATPAAEPPKVAEAPAAAEAPKTEEPAKAATAAPAEIPERLAVLPVPDVSRADEMLNAIAAEKDRLEKQFDDGEIDARALRRGLDDLNRRETMVLVDVKNAQFAAQANTNSTETQWMTLVDQYRTANTELLDPKSEFSQEWDRNVRMLAALDENADKPMGWFLREAHRRARVLLAQTEPAKTGPTAADRQTLAAPKTLADVPAAAPADANGLDEFANIDRLTGLDQERAFARLTPEQRERYLNR